MDTSGMNYRRGYTGQPEHDHTHDGTFRSERPANNSNENPQERHWKPRRCRICFETVLPTFHPPSENIPGIFRPQPRVVYVSEDGGRLLRPCKCKGSSKYVHEGCLQQWRLQNPGNERNFYKCPTCGYKYRLSRLGWSALIVSTATRISLTIVILFLAVFILGFFADTIIDYYNDPWRMFFPNFSFLRSTWSSSRTYYQVEPETWGRHFLKGFAGLGLLSAFKGVLSNPRYYFRLGTGGNRPGRGGRDRLQDVSWLVVLIGLATFLWATWRMVQSWSARILQNISERVVDIPERDQDGDDDDDD